MRFDLRKEANQKRVEWSLPRIPKQQSRIYFRTVPVDESNFGGLSPLQAWER